MNIDLRKIKVFKELSEETVAFSAELFEDGKFVSTISNRGHGGSNDFHPYPETVIKYDNLDVECEIFTLVETYDYVTKNQSKGFVLRKETKFFTSKFPMNVTKLKSVSDYPTWLKGRLKYFKANGYEVLNRNI